MYGFVVDCDTTCWRWQRSQAKSSFVARDDHRWRVKDKNRDTWFSLLVTAIINGEKAKSDMWSSLFVAAIDGRLYANPRINKIYKCRIYLTIHVYIFE